MTARPNTQASPSRRGLLDGGGPAGQGGPAADGGGAGEHGVIDESGVVGHGHRADRDCLSADPAAAGDLGAGRDPGGVGDPRTRLRCASTVACWSGLLENDACGSGCGGRS